jgi:hypothetical protein
MHLSYSTVNVQQSLLGKLECARGSYYWNVELRRSISTH